MTQTCETFEPLIQADLDGELNREERDGLEGHLSSCASCQEARAELTALVDRLRALHVANERAEVEIEIPGVKIPTAPAAAAAQASGSDAASLLDSSMGEVASGPRIGNYVLEHEIARGGMGRVYRAIQISMDRKVALKVLSPEFAENEQFVARFLREAKLAATISDPNLIQIYEVGQEGTGSEAKLYYSMELIEGQDVEEILKAEGRIPQRRAAEIGLGVAQALAAAAEKGIIHRDIKPANILIPAAGGVKLADLGLAKALENEDSSVTMKKTVIGSPNYMSPEQAQDIRKATPHSDVYSLGATLLHMITGEIPFGRGAPIEVLARVLRDPVTIPDVVGGEALEPELKRILARTLEKEPLVRHATALELAADLEKFLASEQGAAAAAPARSKSRRMSGRRSGRARRPASSSEGKLRRSSSEGRVRTEAARASGVARSRQGPPPALWVAAAAALIGVVGLAMFWGGNKPTVEPRKTEVAEKKTAPRIRKAPSLKSAPRFTKRPKTTVKKASGEAERELAYLVQFTDENPELIGARFRKAESFLKKFPTSAQASQARELRDKAETRLGELFKDAEGQALALKKRDKLWKARQVYSDFLTEHGEGIPKRSGAMLAMRELKLEIDGRLKTDLAQVKVHITKGEARAAQALLAKMDHYAGDASETKARGQLALAVAKLLEPRDGAKVEPGVETLLARSRMLLNRARRLYKAGKREAARETLAKLRGQKGFAGLDASTREEAELLAKRLEPKYDPPTPKPVGPKPKPGVQPKQGDKEPDTTALLAMVVRGKVKALDAAKFRYQIQYTFKNPQRALDWRQGPKPRKQEQRFTNWLKRLPGPKGAPVKAWEVHRGRLVGYGHDRRQLLVTFRRERELEVELEVRGRQNLLVALGGDRPAVGGLGYVLPDLPLQQLTPWLKGNEDAQKWLGRLNRRIKISQSRGPAVAVLKEHGFFHYEELFTKRAKLRPRMRFSVVLTPGGEGHAVEIRVKKKSITEVEVKNIGGGPARVSLMTLGSVVFYERITVRGTLSQQFRNRLRRAHQIAQRQKLKGPDAVRQAFEKLEKTEQKKRDKEKEKDKD